MSILPIVRAGHPALRSRAAQVADPTDAAIRQLVVDMAETLEASGGVGLAAPQIAVPLRVVLFYVPNHRVTELAGDGPQERTLLINPEIEPLDDEIVEGWEGCLSLPGLCGLVPRYTRIRYRGLDQDGKPIDRVAAGFHARVVQHECDHLDGVLYPARMRDLTSLGFADEYAASRGSQSAAPPNEEDLD
jgi:peptide deformylase